MIISAPSSPLIGRLFSNNAIISLSSTSVQLVWKIGKCLTHRFKLHRMKTCTCEIMFSTISRWHSWQATPEPVTDFSQCGLSWFSHLAKAPPGCSASASTLGGFVTKDLFGAILLVTMQFSVSILWCFRFSSIYLRYEIVVAGVDQSFFLMPRHWTAETRWLRPPKQWVDLFQSNQIPKLIMTHGFQLYLFT